jgi:NADPH:quinone reductase-like Zn-dependent oxidoreductase
MLNKIIKLFVRTKEVPVDPAKEMVEKLLQEYNDKGIKPSIDRTNDKWMGYGSEVTPVRAFYSKKAGKIKITGGKFTRVRNGHRVMYFGNPFWNLYRITSRVGTLDYVTHSVHK